MPFPPLLNSDLIAQLRAFAEENDFAALYAAYSWRNDEHISGFRDILALELRLTASEKTTGLTLEDVYAIATWGAMRNQGRIRGLPIVLPPHSLHTASDEALPSLKDEPASPIGLLRRGITRGVGPTYISKILRFALPQEYGAIDTRCVRVFGRGDAVHGKFNWIRLKAKNSGYGWYIPASQTEWPKEYGTWVNILRYYASVLPRNCPHPSTFYEQGMRSDGKWECADVEMALFSYASEQVTGCAQHGMQPTRCAALAGG